MSSTCSSTRSAKRCSKADFSSGVILASVVSPVATKRVPTQALSQWRQTCTHVFVGFDLAGEQFPTIACHNSATSVTRGVCEQCGATGNTRWDVSSCRIRWIDKISFSSSKGTVSHTQDCQRGNLYFANIRGNGSMITIEHVCAKGHSLFIFCTVWRNNFDLYFQLST
jgi:hypothetical protein